MQIFVRWFLRMSLVWLGVGMVLALVMAFDPARVPMVRLAHAHSLLAGFVSMMIFGVAYHVLPRFSGRPLESARLPVVHLWAANLGLLGIVTGWLSAGFLPGGWAWLHRGGAVAFALGAALFIYNIWKTLEAPKWNALPQK
jgi:cbb3-type cytochrome oxidase subunit 1